MLNRSFIALSYRHSRVVSLTLLFVNSALTVEGATTTATSKKNRTTVSVIETVPLNGSTATFTVFSGTVGYTGNGLKIQPDNNSNGATTIASVPVMPYTSGSKSKAEIVQQATNFLLPSAADVGKALKAWMATNNYKAATFIYEHELIPSGVNRIMKLTWQLSVVDGGRILFGAPRVIDGDPTFVYITYTPKAVASGLPANWAFADAGVFKWQLRKRDGTPQTDWVSINTNGAYDEPTTNGSDPNFGVNCLADKRSNPNCPAVFTDAKTLMQSTSSNGSIIDYTRSLQPQYTLLSDGSQQPNMAISFDTRSLTHNNSCTNGTIRTAGRYGLTLASTFDRYVFDEDSINPNLIKRTTTSSFSPTQGFDYTQVTALSISQVQGLVINPFAPTGPLTSTSAIPGVQYVAPIYETGDSGQTKIYVSYGGQKGFCDPSYPVIYSGQTCIGYYDGEGNCTQYGPTTIQRCGGYFWWGTNYTLGIDRASNTGWLMHEWYGPHYPTAQGTVTSETVPCPN